MVKPKEIYKDCNEVLIKVIDIDESKDYIELCSLNAFKQGFTDYNLCISLKKFKNFIKQGKLNKQT